VLLNRPDLTSGNFNLLPGISKPNSDIIGENTDAYWK